IKYFVLCGKNNLLYHKLQKLNNEHIIALKYISCRREMNELYDSVDGILTKPGGVTISERLRKRKPIFIYHALPEQDVINLSQLQALGVVHYLNDSEDVEYQLIDFFEKGDNLLTMKSSIENYLNQLINKGISELVRRII